MVNILFVDQGGAPSFAGLTTHLASRGWRVSHLIFQPGATRREKAFVRPDGVHEFKVTQPALPGRSVFSCLKEFEQMLARGHHMRRALELVNQPGFVPDVVVATAGSGVGAYAKALWPATSFAPYLDWWHKSDTTVWAASQGSLETSFNPAEAPCRNLPLLFDFQACDAMLTRSRFQMSEAPGWVQERTIVVPDGVDCDAFCPADPNDPVFQCRGLPPDAPTLSYAEERLDPERGFPDFMAAAAQLQARHKDLHVVVAGEDIPRTQVPGEEPTSCRMTTMEQHDFDIPRLHFVGRLAPERYCALLKRSTVHCHLTRACVPAPSLLQAMATGCTLVVTDVAPVREVLPHPASAAFVKPESPREVADAVSTLLADPGFAQEKGRNARMHTLHSYDQRSQHIATEAVLSSIADPGPDGLRFAS